MLESVAHLEAAVTQQLDQQHSEDWRRARAQTVDGVDSRELEACCWRHSLRARLRASAAAPVVGGHTAFRIVVTTYNPGAEQLERCLRSIVQQRYPAHLFSVAVVDDASTRDGPALQLVMQRFAAASSATAGGSGPRVVPIRNTANLGPNPSRLLGAAALRPAVQDVIVLVDGDDALAHASVLQRLDQVYRQQGALATFGSLTTVVNGKATGSRGVAPLSAAAIKWASLTNSWRTAPWAFSHLKTVKFELWQRVAERPQLLHDPLTPGRFLREGTDQALMFPLLELAGPRALWVPEVLYLYTIDHPENMHANKTRLARQEHSSLLIRSAAPSFEPLMPCRVGGSNSG